MEEKDDMEDNGDEDNIEEIEDLEDHIKLLSIKEGVHFIIWNNLYTKKSELKKSPK